MSRRTQMQIFYEALEITTETNTPSRISYKLRTNYNIFQKYMNKLLERGYVKRREHEKNGKKRHTYHITKLGHSVLLSMREYYKNQGGPMS